MALTDRKIRVAVYGCGNFANRTHIPNLLKLNNLEIVALCDSSPEALRSTAEAFNVPKTYLDGHQLLENEDIDVLYSIVPAYARTDVEATAAAKGIHLFSEKPQALMMDVARQINDAIRQSGVISTVGFRERYRPIFQKARELLADKEIVHVRFQSFRGLPGPPSDESWWDEMDKSGGNALDWGVHATDYARFMTRLDVLRAQAFYCERPAYATALSSVFNYSFTNGATMNISFIAAGGSGLGDEPFFTIFYEGGCLAVYGYDRITVNGETVYEGEEFDPWFEQDRTFIEAVQTGNPDKLMSDYHDGLRSLAPVLAGWESSRRNGECIDIQAFMDSI